MKNGIHLPPCRSANGGAAGRRVSIVALLCSLVFFSSCGRTAQDDPAGVVIGIVSEPTTLNPLAATSVQSHDVINLIYLKLLDEQSDFLNFTPRLAERWSFSADSMSITFHLRRDVRWQDGEPVTAADVRHTWQLQSDEDVAWVSRNIKNSIRDVEVIDDYTVIFHFTNRYPYQLMDANDGVILPQHLTRDIPRSSFQTADFGRAPVGNGPYRLARWVPGQLIELERNPDYYDGERPRLDTVVFRVVADMTTLVSMLKTGGIDCLESLPIDVAKDLEANHPDIKIYRYPSRSMEYIAWNLEHELFRDREVRRALAMAIDIPEMIQTLWGGMARVLDSPVHPILWAHDPGMTRLPYDPDRARAVLAERGWTDSDGDGVLDKDGRPFEFEMTTNQGVQLRADIVTMVQEYLRRVGIRVNARVLEFGTFIDGVIKGTFESCVLGWKTGTRVDLSTFWLSTAVPPSGFNASRYKNPQVDALIGRARTTVDVAEARRLWSQCQKLIYADQAICFLAAPYEVVGLNRRFCGVAPNAIGFFVNLPEWHAGDDCP
ncbi:MAG: peptide-binding protein [Candidatus Krumholzibacteriia bacterium]